MNPSLTGVSPRFATSRAISGLILYSILNTLASLCFKECGTNAAHTWFFFTIGIALGMISLIFIMWVYAGMNVNLGGALLLGISAVAVQVAFWLVYDARLSPLQWVGVALSIVGGVMAVSGKPRPAAKAVPVPSANPGANP
jgi:multidrug transporter EmrE-like cation transporter